MSFYILLNQISTLFVSLGLLTTLSFDSEITSYMYGGSKEDLYLKITGNLKTLAIKPLRENVDSNLLIVTKRRKYYFNLKHNKSFGHKFVEVKEGQVNHAMKSILKTNTYEVLEGSTSIMVINKTRRKMKVNESWLDKKGYFSKGVPLFINGKQVI